MSEEALEKFELLRELGPEERESLLEFLESRRFADGRSLYTQRDEAAELILIAEGSVRLERTGQALVELPDGAALGAATLVCFGERPCTARAVGPVEALLLSRENYLRLRIAHPELALSLQEAIVRSLAQAASALIPGL